MLRLTRVALGGALSAALVMAALSSQAAPPAERELLGVRIWRDYAAVLKRHGEPTRVVPGIALPPEVGVGSVNVSMQTGQAGRMSMPGGAMMGPSMGLSGPPGMPMMGGMMSAGGAGRGMPMMGGPGGLAMGGGRSMPMVAADAACRWREAAVLAGRSRRTRTISGVARLWPACRARREARLEVGLAEQPASARPLRTRVEAPTAAA